MIHLEPFAKLEELALNECKNLTDAAVDSLVRLPAFTELLVNDTQITKSGCGQPFRKLKSQVICDIESAGHRGFPVFPANRAESARQRLSTALPAA